MTEEDWLTSDDPDAMLQFLADRLSPRKTRLFACACCRRILHLIPDRRVAKSLQVSEEFADDAATGEQLAAAYAIAWEVYEEAMDEEQPEEPYAQAVEMACSKKIEDVAGAAEEARLEDYYDEPTAREEKFTERERKAQTEILRDLFGNPFRRAAIVKASMTQDVKRLAKDIYKDRTFDRLPSLADELEKAGCTDREVLQHCRKGKTHSRGCWVLDALLAKE